VCMTRADRYRVLLIRSGATEWDEQDYLPGVADLPMCPHERERLAVDDAMVGPAAVASVLSAGDEASTETASIVARSLGVKAKKCVDLGDVDLGLWQGLRMSELRERAPKVYKQWVDDPLSLQPPEGESLRSARDRLVDAVLRSVEKSAKSLKAPKGEVPTIAVVLRPIALSLVRSRLLGDSSVAGWCRIGEGPRYEWHEIPGSRVDSLRIVPAGAA
jgi:broad specificity phosphatase PhoE